MKLRSSILVGLVALSMGWYIGQDQRSSRALPLAQSFGSYDYKNSGCTTVNDPVGVIFYNGNGQHNHVRNHAHRSDHGGWSHDLLNGVFLKYFADNFGCSQQDDQSASQAGYGHNQYHMRWEVTATDDAGQAYSATPHYEDWSWTQQTHCVEDAGAGGYVKGKNDIKKNWRDEGNEHPWPTSPWAWWGNTIQITQDCGYSVGSDGYVLYLDMYGNDTY